MAVTGDYIDHDQPCAVSIDRYCTTHGVVNCTATKKPGRAEGSGQLARIEARLNRICRHLGLETDDD